MMLWLSLSAAARYILLSFRMSLLLVALMLGTYAANAQIVSNFSANNTSGCSPLTVQFINQSSGPISSYYWNFGNGNTSNQPNPGVIYVNPGTYTVRLRVTDGLSSDTLIRTAYITVFAEPTANFTGSPTLGCTPQFTNFQDMSTTGSAPISSFSWDFGDGSLGSGALPPHLYSSSGSFDVTLVVTDTNGCTDNIRKDNFVTLTDSPTVNMNITALNSCQLPINYSFVSPNPLQGHSYVWEFGDGTTASGPNAQHSYTVNGQYTAKLTVTGGNGCTSVLTQTLFINPSPPTANFNTLGNEFCWGVPIQFANTSSNAVSYTWYFGDGTSSTAVFPTHTYALPGIYSVTLIARDGICSDTLIRNNYLTIKPAPNAAFTSQGRLGCGLPLVVDFQADTTYATSFLWNFGDTSFATVPNPTHVYQYEGFFDVTLVVQSADGCRDSVTFPNYTQVIPPTADFIADTLRGCAPLVVDFLDLSVSTADPIVNWIWDFGDGGTYWGRNATHMYTNAGLYDVRLVVVTQSGCRDTVIYKDLIGVGNVPNVSFGANVFGGSGVVGGGAPLVICPSDSVFFTNQTGAGTAWLWDFGNGNVSSYQNPSYLFTDTGSFDISLTVDHYGCQATFGWPGGISVVGPLADFNVFPDLGCGLPFSTQFTDQSVGAHHWQWSFGDGTTDTIPSPSHTYNAPGSFVVSLTVLNDNTHCDHTWRDTVHVQPMSAAFTASISGSCNGATATFTNISTNATDFWWDFGDGANSNQANPTHVYQNPGTYSVSLIARNAAGCADTMLQPSIVTVNGPVVDFVGDVTLGCVPLSVNFTDLSSSSAPITNWLWEYGTGGTSSSQNPSKVFTNKGLSFVRLTVTDANGCSAVLTKPAYINATQPNSGFYAPTTTGCANQPISLINLSGSGNLTYLWQFGDGDTSTVKNPIHTYASNGNYTVTLTTYDQNGCANTFARPNYIKLTGPAVNFFASPTQKACPPLTVNFQDLSSNDAISWYWDFGDGTHSVLANPSKIYTFPGMYTVRLAVMNAAGCTDTLTMPDLIDISGPSGTFNFFPKSGCSPLDVTFIADAPTAINWTWDFGDGSLGAGDTVTHTFYDDTVATPVLVVEDLAGCVVAITVDDSVNVTAGPDAGFRTNRPAVCLGQSIQFFDTSYSEVPLIAHFWDFGDGNTSTLPNPTHTYAAAGSYPIKLKVVNVNGCSDSLISSLPLVVSPPPTAQFLLQPPGGCVPFSLTLSDSSITTFPIVQWNWKFGDGTTASNVPFVGHTYSTPGSYQLQLKVRDAQGCVDSTQRTLDVSFGPTPNFTANSLTGCAPKLIQFTDLSASNQPIAGWFWDFGDGTTSTLRSPQYSYTANGTYTVSLTVTDINGCAKTETKPQYIQLQNPIADFISDTTGGCPPFPVTFTHTSNSNSPIASFFWDFGDGTTSSQENPSHTYSYADTFAVRLIIVNGQGCRDTVAYPQAIVAYAKPIANFSLSDNSLCLPEGLTVNNTSMPGSSPIASFAYNFGNGTTSSNPMASAQYTTPGLFNIKLKVTDFYGCKDSVTKQIVAQNGPVANFRANDSLGCGAQSFTFYDLSGGSQATSWLWSFGDGTTSSQAQPTHPYTASGNFDVKLKITDANGCSDSLRKPNYIQLDGPQAAFSVNQTASCASATLAFTDNSYADTTLTSWAWTFGDGQTATGQNVSHTYSSGGVYAVKLTITNVIGCSSTFIDTIQANTSSPVAYFGLPDTLCAPVVLNLRDSSRIGGAPIVIWDWDLDNGNTANTPNPVVNFFTQGNYSLRLQIIDNNGCTDSLRRNIVVKTPPTANFATSDTNGCALNAISFTDFSAGSAPIRSWLWNFGNGDTSHQQNPAYSYSQGGSYDVRLTVKDENGCSGTILRKDLLSMQAPLADFTLDDDEGCKGLTIHFNDLSQTDTTLVSWFWEFGDSLTSTQRHPSHRFSEPGTYTVRLTIMDAIGCGAIAEKRDTIRIFDGPDAKMGLSDTVGCRPLIVTFRDSSSSSTGFGGRMWKFGSIGTTSLPNPTRAFTNPGNYPIRLLITDANGCQDSVVKNLEVFGPPQVDFSASDSQACAATSIQFLDQTQSQANLVYWRWDLGDGTSSQQQFPQHTYASNGAYNVKLFVRDEFGCRDSLTKFQFVQIQPALADFTLNNARGCTGVNAIFSDQSFGNGGVTNWLWNFGDGTTSTQANPGHSYNQPGTYTVSLSILDAAGCIDSVRKVDTVQVLRSPVANFGLSDTAGCAPMIVQFTDMSVGTDAGIAGWNWRFGTGSPNLSQHPTQFFANAGRYGITLTATDSNGCPHSQVKYLRVYDKPQAAFAASDSIGCASKTVNFYDQSQSQSGLRNWRWDFGDGGSSTQAYPLYTFQNNGYFDVKLLVADRFGCEDSLVKRQYIRLQPPVADFALSTTAGCTGTAVAFTDKSTSDTTFSTYLWDFGDGNISTAANPSHTYQTPGVYSLRLTVTDAKGCSDTEVLPNAISISAGPVVNYQLSDTAGCTPLLVQFTDQSSALAGIRTWRWSMGNGGIAAGPNPMRVYSNPGRYQVVLTVTDSIGCQSALSREVNVYAPPAADFTADDSLGCAARQIHFFDLSASQSGLTSWQWDFGDGSSSTQQFPNHIYQNNGDYDVKLIVTDRFGCSDLLLKREYIRLDAPDAAFSLNQNQGCTGLNVAFRDLSLSDTTIVSWHWDFGDGSTSGRANPTHYFGNSGVYSISLTVVDAKGCSDTHILPNGISISRGPSVDFSLSDTMGCAPMIVQLTDLSSSITGIQTRNWRFSNGGIAGGSGPMRAFNTPGSYQVYLTVTDSSGCVDSLSKNLQVFPPPLADFDATDTSGCSPKVVNFLDLSSSQAGITSWHWDFGTGDTSIAQFPTYVFSQNGQYHVTLRVTDRFGCEDQLIKRQFINLKPPIADFNLNQARGCQGLPVSFSDQSSSDTTILAWFWDFGDNATSTQRNPSHIYQTAGTYTVSLTITDAKGCSETVSKIDTIEVFAPPVAAIAMSDTAGCRPLLVQLADQSSGAAAITQWSWNLGNQSSSVLAAPNYTFAQSGLFSIDLTVTDANGCTALTRRPLEVYDLPQAAFYAPDTIGCAPEALNFLNASSGPRPLTSWQWRFGDGGTASIPQPSHTYQQAGRYTVSLKVTDQKGCTDSLRRPAYIRLSDPQAAFSIDTLIACPGTSISLRDGSGSDTTLTNWTWDFGDGSAWAHGPNPNHRYAQAGNYTIRLRVTDALGCTDSMSAPAPVQVLTPPLAAYQGLQAGCEPLLGSYQDRSTNAANWQWYLDGVANGGGQQINHLFAVADTYQLALVVTDQMGCTDTAEKSIVVHPLPTANFSSLDTVSCAPDFVRFRDRSSANASSWLWKFGDGQSSTLPHPVHSYLKDGSYTVRLKVTTAFGCVDSSVRFGYVNMRHPKADFVADFDQPCAPLSVDFRSQAIIDTGIDDWFWIFGDGTTGSGNPASHTYYDPGVYSVSLVVTDSIGCQDTVRYPDLLRLKENAMIPAPVVHRVTVQRDDQVDIVFQQSRHTDFAEYVIYREWPQASGTFIEIHRTSFADDTLYTDYGLDIGILNCLENTYCYKVTVVNDCGTETPLLQARSHCTIEATAVAMPDRMLLDWNAYKGWDVAFYEIYRVGSYDLGSVDYVDRVPGQSLQYIDRSARCSNIYTYRIKAIGFADQQYSWSDTTRARNSRTADLDPNEVVRATVENNRSVLAEWLPVTMQDLTTIVLERRSIEYPEWTAVALLEPGDNSYLDHDVAVNRESYSYRITARDSCGFLSEISNMGKSILLKPGPTNQKHLLSWSAYEGWGQGVDYYELEVYNDFTQSWELVDIVPDDTLSYNVSEIYLDQPQYCFRIRAHESGGHQALSLSNEVCIPVQPEIFAPNAFTPNSDGYNDEFYLKGVFIDRFHLMIFDRWGKKIFESSDLDQGWDGMYKGQAAVEGVYTFVARGIGYDNLQHEISGTVTLIR